MSPYFASYGLHPWLFLLAPSDSPVVIVDKFLQELHVVHQVIRNHLERTKEDCKRFSDWCHQEGPPLAMGNWIWLSTWHLRTAHPCKKLDHYYLGPFPVKAGDQSGGLSADSVTYHAGLPGVPSATADPACGVLRSAKMELRRAMGSPLISAVMASCSPLPEKNRDPFSLAEGYKRPLQQKMELKSLFSLAERSGHQRPTPAPRVKHNPNAALNEIEFDTPGPEPLLARPIALQGEVEYEVDSIRGSCWLMGQFQYCMEVLQSRGLHLGGPLQCPCPLPGLGFSYLVPARPSSAWSQGRDSVMVLLELEANGGMTRGAGQGSSRSLGPGKGCWQGGGSAGGPGEGGG
ncbi:hypothetical protein L345_09594, partial [Ophiophagus hannah]